MRPNFGSPACCPMSSRKPNAGNMLGAPPWTLRHGRPLSPRRCPPWRSAPACWARWSPGSGWPSAVAPTTLAVLMLLPLSAFEATTGLPGTAVQLTRSRLAARRLLDLAPPNHNSAGAKMAEMSTPLATGRLSADVDAGHRDSQCTHVTVDLAPGAR